MKSFMKTFLAVILLSGLFFTTSCQKESSIRKEVISLDNISDVIEKVKDDNLMTKEEIAMFAGGLQRLGQSKDSLIGKTVGQIIDMQNDYIRNNNFMVLANTGKRIEMSLAYAFKYIGLQPINDSASNTKANIIVFDIKNNSTNDIKEVQGILQLFNSQNQIVKQFHLTTKDIIKPDSSLRFTQPFKHDDTDQRDMLLRTSNDLIYLWTPESLEFVNGKRITLLK